MGASSASSSSGAGASSSAFDTPLDRAYFITSDEPSNASTPTLSIEGDQLSSRTPLWVADTVGAPTASPS
jgi:hypothetical protein